MGEVYEARHARLPGRFAIKVLAVRVGMGSPEFRRFRREAEIASTLRHPNLVQVVDFNLMTDGSPYIVMEFLEGTDLSQELQLAGRLSPRRTASIVAQVAAALPHAHTGGVVHRDLKPQNVFLVPLRGPGSDFVKVVDFGISKVKSAATVTTEPSLMGTPQYMSPEQAHGRTQDIDARTDQFALAAMAYEMLSGRPAFSGDSVPAILYDITNSDPAPLGVPFSNPDVEPVLRRGLAKPKSDRFPSNPGIRRCARAGPGTLRPARARRTPGQADRRTARSHKTLRRRGREARHPQARRLHGAPPAGPDIPAPAPSAGRVRHDGRRRRCNRPSCAPGRIRGAPQAATPAGSSARAGGFNSSSFVRSEPAASLAGAVPSASEKRRCGRGRTNAVPREIYLTRMRLLRRARQSGRSPSTPNDASRRKGIGMQPETAVAQTDTVPRQVVRWLPAVSIAALVAVAAAPDRATAQDDAKAQAEAQVRRGETIAPEKGLQDALVPLRQARALFPSPKLHFNFGIIYKELSQDVERCNSSTAIWRKWRRPRWRRRRVQRSAS